MKVYLIFVIITLCFMSLIENIDAKRISKYVNDDKEEVIVYDNGDTYYKNKVTGEIIMNNRG
ncbi:hypothetical protein FF38_04107 [Lucilia cuprina]|uniref:Uncharacterized protein n=1 Tax=Lucilia cuprina TaxID=7375 RepID=A0A0L0BRP4_LUCCU|nr:hypothetical protein CVS40_7402 [Lucilia cuprina]KNC22750.1 hypothetical protein FF38_04107 [Lucilia cuprina]